MIRDELVFRLSVKEAALAQAACEEVERVAVRQGSLVSRDLAVLKNELAAFVGRATGRADTAMRPPSPASGDDVLVGTEEVARMTGTTEDAVRKACRHGRYRFAAKKIRGRWYLPAVDVLAELEGR